MTLKGIAETAAAWFGQDPHLTYRPLDDFLADLEPEHADASREHIIRSPSMSIEAARADFGYAPNYTSAEAIADGLRWLIADGQLNTGGRPLQP
jgi:nucleoside-diphosphate-sugar epimerase